MLDWLLVVLVLAYAVSGYWQGFISGAFATLGLLLGGLLGIWLAPEVFGDAALALWVSLAALFVCLSARRSARRCCSTLARGSGPDQVATCARSTPWAARR